VEKSWTNTWSYSPSSKRKGYQFESLLRKVRRRRDRPLLRRGDEEQALELAREVGADETWRNGSTWMLDLVLDAAADDRRKNVSPAA